MSQRLEFAPVALHEKPIGMRLYTGPNRRSAHPIDQLARRLDAVCRTAVDAWQIAAVLESDGINDSIARDEYGMNDVFELAEELFRRVPLRLRPVQVQSTGRILVKTLRELSSGPLLAWPLLSIPALLTLIGPNQLEWGALVGLIVGWAWALGSSRLAERLRCRHDRAALACDAERTRPGGGGRVGLGFHATPARGGGIGGGHRGFDRL
jgi:hypothetical protein